MMRSAVLAFAIVSTAVVLALAAQRTERAAADYNISGQWYLDLGAGGLCTATVAETYDSPPTYALSFDTHCGFYGPPFGKMTGSIDANAGSFSVSRTDSDPISGGSFSMTGTVSPDNHSMSGMWTAHSHVTPGLEGTFTATGGNGDPKPATPTPTQPLVGGIVVNVAPIGGGPGAAFDAWWMAAIAGATIVTLGGAVVLRRRRLAASEIDR